MKASCVALSCGVALLTAACGSRDADLRARADSDLARDLALAGAQTSPPPTFQDTTVAPAPTTVAQERKVKAPKPRTETRKPAPRPERVEARHEPPAPTPVEQAATQAPVQTAAPQPVAPAPEPAPPLATIAAGSAASMRSGKKVCTTSSMPGDKLTATLSSPLSGSNGAEIPAGSTVVLEVAAASSGKDATSATIAFRVRSVVIGDKTYNVDAEASPMDPLQQMKVDGGDPHGETKKVIGGAIAGAILGRIIGHDTKGTLIGAATGAAAGAAVSRAREKWEACLPEGAQMRFKLTAPLVIS